MNGPGRPATGTAPRSRLLWAALAALAATLLLSACGNSGKGLIPSAHAGPLLGDFEEVLQAAENGNGNCSSTESALAKTDSDFAHLPSSVNRELRGSLLNGIKNLRARAHELCEQLLASGTRTNTTPTTTTDTTPTGTTPTTKTNTTPTTTAPSGKSPPGGTQAPEGESQQGGGEGAGGSGEGAGAAEEETAGGAGAPEATK